MRPLYPPNSVIRIAYYNGEIVASEHPVFWYNQYSRRLTFLFKDAPSEAIHHGLLITRLYEFNQAGPHGAVTFVPASTEEEFRFQVERFKRRLARAMKKGGVADPIKIQAAHTPCRGCVFAAMNGDTQTGCKLGKLDKYRENGAQIVEARDDSSNFFIVNGRQCMFKRVPPWCKDVPESNWADVVRKEMSVRTDFLLLVGSAADVDGIQTTLRSIAAQSLAAGSAVIVNNQSEVPAGRVAAAVNLFVQSNPDLKLNWKLVDVRERQLDGSRVPWQRAVDIAAPQLKGHFYAIVKPGVKVPERFAEAVDRAVIDELKRFVMLQEEGGVGPTIALGFHRSSLVNGNKAVPASSLVDGAVKDRVLTTAAEKAEFLADNIGPHMTAKYSEVRLD